ncbi:MFS transporter [Limosilactobacillus mucosae]|uniref:MFS transporter n=1 Tax=Limosilactobacillus mucosae TaxID=97478 RepID=A0AAJ1MB72_LIMMU|nr:MFS transporter [Limosilactobacillus mucosae]MDC2829814.1 MFS transporter [Limosilactobacillus mucosae]MDC2837270.1 MFS transporter [Limosilactobacillus mucosae]MDC2849492.1 MFS transporter [Limosilactobacillus mucosae]MDC2853538.1 MFS transporter [Limosilactobacillus mucosae]
MDIAKNQVNTVAKQRLSVSLYLNYLIHGMGMIILAQNMNSLGAAWHQPIKIVSFVISGIGIGRLISYLITGFLSDKISRKFFVEVGMFCYAAFALGMPLTKNIGLAYAFAILAGVANSSLDAGTYTTFVEMNGGNGAYTILIKAFVSVGEFILPILVTILANQGMWFGWSFMAMVVLLAINFCLILPLKFPAANQASGDAVNEQGPEIKGVAKKVMTGALVVYGYSSMALMIWFTQWITMFAQQTLHMSNGAAHFLLSLYSIGSITGVLMLFALLGHNVKESHLLLVVNMIALVSLLVIMQSEQSLLMQIASFTFGLSAASGIMQTGLTIFMKLYPTHRGMITGVFYFFGSIASFTVPIITGMLSDINMAAVMAGDLVMAGIGILVAAIVMAAEKKG